MFSIKFYNLNYYSSQKINKNGKKKVVNEKYFSDFFFLSLLTRNILIKEDFNQQIYCSSFDVGDGYFEFLAKRKTVWGIGPEIRTFYSNDVIKI